MTIKEQLKPRKGYGPGVRKRYLAEDDDHLKIPRSFCLLCCSPLHEEGENAIFLPLCQPISLPLHEAELCSFLIFLNRCPK